MSKSAFYAAKESIRKHRDLLFQENEEIKNAAWLLISAIEDEGLFHGTEHALIVNAAYTLSETLEKWTERHRTRFTSSSTSSDYSEQE